MVAMFPVLTLSACESEPAALTVDGLSIARDEVLGLSSERLERLGEITAFGLAVASGEGEALGAPLVARAEREYQRQEQLYEQPLMSEQAFSDATYELEQLRIEVTDAERELAYATVRAPISGTVTSRLVNLGDHVQVGEQLFEIVDFDSMVARVFVPEKELRRLSRGQEARLTASALGDQARQARILRSAPTVDSRSGTVKVTLEVPDKAGLRPGMFVEVDLIAAVDPDALLVPKRALVYDEEQPFVFRVVDGEDGTKVERLLVETVLESRNVVQVPGDQLAVGDRIVVAGQAGLKDGAEVRLLDLQEALETFGDGAEASDVAAALGNEQ